MEIVLPEVRLSFPDIWKPGKPPANNPTAEAKFGGQFIFAPGSEAHKRAAATMEAVAKAAWGDNWAAFVGAIPPQKKCLRDGNLSLDKQGAIRDGYKDQKYIVARNKLRPLIVDRNSKVTLTQESGRPYGGCYVNVKVDIYAMDRPGEGKQINATLMVVQWVGPGTAFGGGTPTLDGMEDLPELEGEGSIDTPAGAPSAEDLF